MLLKYKAIFLFLIILSTCRVHSQAIRPLTVGESTPDVKVTNLVNYPDQSFKISDFKGKLLIIDFWETTCSGCVEFLDKLEILQQKFGKEIKVITVTRYGNKEQVLKALKMFNRILKDGTDLPIVIQDTLLSRIFPNELVSHFVWIGADGKVKAITDKEYVNEANIQKVLKQEPINWHVKEDILGFVENKPLLEFAKNGTAREPNRVFYSAFTGYLNGADETGERVLKDSVRNIQISNQFNHGLLSVCYGAVKGRFGVVKPKSLILQVSDSSRFFKPQKQDLMEWKLANYFCYSVSLPLHFSDSARWKYISKDLAHRVDVLFGLSSQQLNLPVPTLVLVRINDDYKLFKSDSALYKNDFQSHIIFEENKNISDKTKILKALRNASFGDLTWYLNEHVPGIPLVIDETGIPKKFRVDMDFKTTNFQDIQALRSDLQRYGLDLKEEIRTRPMLIIKENGSKHQQKNAPEKDKGTKQLLK